MAAALIAGSAAARPASVREFDLQLRCNGEQRTLRAPPEGVQVLEWQGQQARVSVDGVQRRLVAVRDGATLHLALDAAVFSFEEVSADPEGRKRCRPAPGARPGGGRGGAGFGAGR